MFQPLDLRRAGFQSKISTFDAAFQASIRLGLSQVGPQLHSLFSELVHIVKPTDSNEC